MGKLSKFQFVMKRDFFALFFMSLCLLNQLPLILHLAFIGSNVSWMIVVAMKKQAVRIDAADALTR